MGGTKRNGGEDDAEERDVARSFISFSSEEKTKQP